MQWKVPAPLNALACAIETMRVPAFQPLATCNHTMFTSDSKNNVTRNFGQLQTRYLIPIQALSQRTLPIGSTNHEPPTTTNVSTVPRIYNHSLSHWLYRPTFATAARFLAFNSRLDMDHYHDKHPAHAKSLGSIDGWICVNLSTSLHHYRLAMQTKLSRSFYSTIRSQQRNLRTTPYPKPPTTTNTHNVLVGTPQIWLPSRVLLPLER